MLAFASPQPKFLGGTRPPRPPYNRRPCLGGWKPLNKVSEIERCCLQEMVSIINNMLDDVNADTWRTLNTVHAA